MPNFRAPFNRSENISFQPWGLGGYNRIHVNGWQIKTLKEAMTALGDSEVQYQYILYSYKCVYHMVQPSSFCVHVRCTICIFAQNSPCWTSISDMNYTALDKYSRSILQYICLKGNSHMGRKMYVLFLYITEPCCRYNVLQWGSCGDIGSGNNLLSKFGMAKNSGFSRIWYEKYNVIAYFNVKNCYTSLKLCSIFLILCSKLHRYTS